MGLLIENAGQIITCHTNGYKFKAGKYQSEIGLIKNSGIFAENGIIKWIGKKIPVSFRKSITNKIDAKGKIILPGFIDSHTHLVFAGDRANEYSMRIKGASYEEIAKAGGGIIKTVDATKKASKQELKKLALKRILTSISFGVTTIEAKSGYGLDTNTELKMLDVINELRKEIPIEIFATLLAAHAFPKDISRKEYIDKILYEIIPQTAEKNLASFIDAFCEKNYYTPKETELIFEQGRKFGLIPKLHTNQFYSVGGIEAAVKSKAISVDHLEVMSKKEIKSLMGRNIIACVLPSVSYFLNISYAPARELIQNKIPVALATDFNPGSSMTQNIQIVMSMAVQLLKMNIEETINAVTINAAASLGISNRTGSIETGKQADLLIFDTNDYRDILYHFGVNQLEKVIKRGKVIHQA
jgi:imidazolonepropionase